MADKDAYVEKVHAKLDELKLIFKAALILLAGISGCAYPISYELRAKADRDLTYPVVAKDPVVYKGKTVIWGGIVVLFQSQPNQTVLTVVETPLDKWGVPQDESNSRGRFIARVPRYLDESLYGEAMKVTLAGEIAGEKIRPVDGLQVRYPIVLVREFHLFRERYYYPYERSYYFNDRSRFDYDEPSPFHGIH